MPTAPEIYDEIARHAKSQSLDGVAARSRAVTSTIEKYVKAAAESTGRSVILYHSTWQDINPNSRDVSINDADIQGLMTMIHDLKGGDLDLVLHSPGGSIDAAEAFVAYLRSKFDHIRVVVPNVAMSAATMIACSADVVVMGKHSFLGPIDPQLLNLTPGRAASVHAILEQFARAKKEIGELGVSPAVWMPILSQYGPDLLICCERYRALAERLVRGWLKRYMFASDPDSSKPDEIAAWLGNNEAHGSHGRHIARDELEAKGMAIHHLEQDQGVQDAFLSIFHAATVGGSVGFSKIMSNSNGVTLRRFANKISR